MTTTDHVTDHATDHVAAEALQKAEAEVERLKEIKMNQASLIAAVNYCLSEFPSDRSSVYLAPIMENLFSK